MTIVCGTDFSEASQAALQVAGALGARLGHGPLKLVHVLDPALVRELEPSELAVFEQRARLRLDEDARRLRARFVPLEVACVVEVGTASEVLADVAAAATAELIVVSAQGLGRSRLFGLGGTSERLTAASSTPVLVVRDAAPFLSWIAEVRPLRILLGFDTRASSERALALVAALRLAGPCDIVVAHVYHGREARARYGVERAGHWMDVDPALEALVVRDLRTQVDGVAGADGLELMAYLGVGRLGDHLLEIAADKHADLIVVGSHQPRGLRRLASVSNIVLHGATVSVVTVPALLQRSRTGDAAPPRSVVAAVDFSESSTQVALQAYDLLAAQGGTIHLVHVAEPSARRDAEMLAQLRALEPAWAPGRNIVTHVDVRHADDVAETVCTAGARAGAEIICIGDRASSRFSRALQPSHAAAIVRRSDRPVLIVKPTA